MSDDDMRIVPERDDIRPRSSGKKPARPRAKSPGKKTAQSAPQSSVSSGTPVMTIILCLFVVLLSGAAAYLYLQTENLSAERDALAQRIADIESKLSVTDESLSQSGAAMQSVLKDHSDQLELHFSEIDKLWAVTNKRNKNWIEELQRGQKNTNSRVDSLVRSLSRVDPIITGYDGIQSRLETISSQLLVQSATVDDLSSRTRDLADTSAKTNSKLNAQATSIQQHQEAIDAIDQYRIQINRRLLRLEQSLAPAPAPAGGT